MRLPLTGLRARLIAFSVVVVAASIATTAVIASRSTSDSIQQQYSQDIGTDSRIYDALLGYAATHSSWSGMTQTALASLAGGVGRVTIATMGRHVLASSDGSLVPPATSIHPAATVNPLAVDSSLTANTETDGIDSRALGPFTLSAAARQIISAAAQSLAACGSKYGYHLSIQHFLNGRAWVQLNDIQVTDCLSLTLAPSVMLTASPATTVSEVPTNALLPTVSGGAAAGELPDILTLLSEPTNSEKVAADQLTQRFLACVAESGDSQPDGFPSSGQVGFLDAVLALPLNAQQDSCLGAARRAQLSTSVAPPVLLFIAGTSSLENRPGLSQAGLRHIVLAASIIGVAAVLIVVLMASGATRPLRVLTRAVRSVPGGAGPKPIRVTGTREVAQLAHAFNDMSAALTEAQRRRQELISDVAHELRTPLGNIRGWLEAVHDGVAQPDSELVSSLVDESHLLQSIIDDLQILALADADRLSMHPEPTDLADIVDKIAVAHRSAATQKGLELHVRTRGDLRCSVDSVRIRQAVSNLVSNAIRYTDAGSVTITARGVGSKVVITVEDTGVGLSATDLGHVFDRFWRAEKSRARSTGGSGLGLAITEHLVQAHRGTITARSEDGVGTTFEITLPRGE